MLGLTPLSGTNTLPRIRSQVGGDKCREGREDLKLQHLCVCLRMCVCGTICHYGRVNALGTLFKGLFTNKWRVWWMWFDKKWVMGLKDWCPLNTDYRYSRHSDDSQSFWASCSGCTWGPGPVWHWSEPPGKWKVFVCVCVCTGGEWGSQQQGPMRHRDQFHCWQLFTLKLSFFLWLLLQRHHSWSNLGGAQVWKYTVILVCLQHKMIWSFFDVAVIVNYHQSV